MKIIPAVVTRTLASFLTIILVANFAIWNFQTIYAPGHPMGGLPRFFSVAGEGNFASYYSSFGLLLAAFILAIIALSRVDKLSPYWWSLSGIFCYLSVDEGAQIHDAILGPTLNSMFGPFDHSAFHYSWVPVGCFAIVLLGLFFGRFLLLLPRRRSAMFCLAGGTFLFGAIGMEMVAGVLIESGRSIEHWLFIAVMVEETLEMVGVLIFIRELLNYAEQRGVVLAVRIGETREGENSP